MEHPLLGRLKRWMELQLKGILELFGGYSATETKLFGCCIRWSCVQWPSSRAHLALSRLSEVVHPWLPLRMSRLEG